MLWNNATILKTACFNDFDKMPYFEEHNTMENIFGSTHFNAIGPYLKDRFGGRIAKLAIDGGFTCPNRDGTKGTGGCIYCSADGGGHFASDISGQIKLLSAKWPDSKYIAYFQSYTNTYAPVDQLRKIYSAALSAPGVCGLAIATRPDCLSSDVLALLSELNQKTFLWIELGLQTSNDETARRINRCYPLSTFDEAMENLSALGIRAVVHLIFGLPGETHADMLASVNYVAAKEPFGVKLHELYITKDTALAKMDPSAYHLLEKKEYINLVVDALERLPQTVTIHRLTGDPPKDTFLAPEWCLDKRSVLNGIQTEFKNRMSFQGSAYSPTRPSL